MDDSQTKQNNLLDTTDCLEAVGVFRGWKNFFFIIALLCLIVLQASFWLVDRGCIAPCDKAGRDICVTACRMKMLCVGYMPGQTDVIKEAAEKVAAEPNKPAEKPQQPPPLASQSEKARGFPFSITFEHLCWTIRIVNGFLVLTAVLYCLCMLFSLKVSLIGRLGGINHISRAFFLSLIMVVLLLLGQMSFGQIPGVIYTPCELSRWYNTETTDIFSTALYYLRFSGYGLLALLLLIFSQIRSSRWTKTVLRRLEVI
jgi:hypothetical protein